MTLQRNADTITYYCFRKSHSILPNGPSWSIISIEIALAANFSFQLDVKDSLELLITCDSQEQTLMLNTLRTFNALGLFGAWPCIRLVVKSVLQTLSIG